MNKRYAYPGDKIIFHHPAPLTGDGVTGSSVRPAKIAKGLENIGYQVVYVTGFSSERKRKWQHALKNLDGVVGVYSEIASMPISLSDSDHIPRKPLMDWFFFRKIRRHQIPVGVFYRDLHWMHMHLKSLPLWKNLIKTPFHYLEVLLVAGYATHLFTPSPALHHAIPLLGRRFEQIDLPPGAPERKDYGLNKSLEKKLTVLYVGGVTPPLKDISPILDTAAGLTAADFVICCPQKEWEKVKNTYEVPTNVNVVHKSGGDVIDLYGSATIFFMMRERFPYQRMAMPVKLFESIGHGLPVITNKDTAAGDFVEEMEAGWVVNSVDEAREIIAGLTKNPEALELVTKNVRLLINEHTWEKRAEKVVSTFLGWS